MRLIVGLGNPGKEYEETRHNVGFKAIEAFMAREGMSAKNEKKFQAEIASGELSKTIYHVELDKETGEETRTEEMVREKIVLAMPQTYMNLSGTTVSKIMQFYKLKRHEVLIIHDDVALDTGRLKVSQSRGAGGQHGVEDIIQKIGGKDFCRLRLGVGPDPGGDRRADYVLKKIPKAEQDLVNEMIADSVSAISDWVFIDPKADTGKFIEKYNGQKV